MVYIDELSDTEVVDVLAAAYDQSANRPEPEADRTGEDPDPATDQE